jgi:uncharacterized protein
MRPLALISVVLVVAGCAGHSERTRDIRTALDVGNPQGALALINEELEVDSAKQVPADVGGDNTLLLLDRAMVLQVLNRPQLSSRDLEIADKQIETLDLSRNAADDIGKYLFSDDVGPYKAPAYEKLLINTMNMVNYLARSDLNGARIEARRLAVMQKFIADHQDPAESLLGPGSYLAGFTFEKSGRPQEALRYYDEALKYGRYPSLQEPVRRLAAITSYRSPRIRQILGEAGPNAGGPPPAAPPSTTTPAPAPGPELADLLVIVNFGRVPAKISRRIPIGLALTYASGAISPYNASRANAIAAQGLVTWINYPELGKPRGQYDQPEFALNGQWQPLEGALAVDLEARRAWDKAKGAVIAAAITRMIARVVAGETARRASGGGWAGLLVSLGLQATLTATDTPDTRGWNTLPARIAFGRLRLQPGTYNVLLGARSVRKSQRVTLRPGGFAVVNLTALH